MSAAALVRQMVERGLTHEQALIALEVVEASDQQRRMEKREQNAERQRRHRASRNVTPVTRDARDAPTPLCPPDKEAPKPQEINPPISPRPVATRGGEKVDYDLVQNTCLEAAGLSDFRAEKSPGLMNLAPILGLLNAGFTLQDEIAPAIRAKAASGFKFRSWSLVPDLVTEFAEKYRKASSTPRTAPKEIDWGDRLKGWQDGIWPHSWGPRPGEAGCRAPAALIERIAA